MSRRGLPRRVHLSWLAPGDCESPAGANRRNWLVGKQSTISNRKRSRLASFLGESSSSLGTLYGVRSFPGAPRQDEQLRGLRSESQSRSALLHFLRSYPKTPTARFTHIPFSCNDFSSGACYKTLTTDCFERNIPSPRGGSKRTALSKSPNGPVAGLSPENVES